MERRRSQRDRGLRGAHGRGAGRQAHRQAGVRPRRHRLSACRRGRPSHPRAGPGRHLRSRRPPGGHHRHAVAGRVDPGQHRHRGHAGASLRGGRHHRRRQVDGRLAAPAQGHRGKARFARPDPRSAQRVRFVAARTQRAHRHFVARPAVLAVPAGGVRRSPVPRARDRSRRAGRAARPDPPSQEHVPQPAAQRLCPARRRCGHRGYACALPRGRPHQADRRAHGAAQLQERPPRLPGVEDADRGGAGRSALSLHVQFQAHRGHNSRDDRSDLPRPAPRSPRDLLRNGRAAVGGGQFGLFGAGEAGLRHGAVERRQAPSAADVRGSSPLHAGGPAAGIRADPPRAVAHRQGRAQIWLLSRRRDPAAGRTRPDHPVAVLHRVLDATGQRAGPGDHQIGDRRIPPRRPCRSSLRWASARRSPSAKAWRPPCA